MKQRPLTKPLTKKLSKQPKPKPLHELQVTMEAKQVFALAMEGVGGLQGMIDWIKASAANRAAFYANYAKLIPLTVNANATVNVKRDDEEIRAKLSDAFARLINARKQEEARTGLVQLDGITYRKADGGSLVPTEAPFTVGDGVIIDNCDKPLTIEHEPYQRVTEPEPPPPPR
jgi:hypothetical protein